MAHEITSSDGLVLAGKPAWHGLGIVVENAPSPDAALKLAGLDWTVLESDVVSGTFTRFGQQFRISTDERKMLCRSDNQAYLADVSAGYSPIQNAELAEFCEMIQREGGAKIESAGSIQGGRRVWFLCRGESVHVLPGDEVKTYLLVSTAHDGSKSFTAQPVNQRVVCSNTLHMAFGESDASVTIRHEGDIKEKMRRAADAMKSLQSQTEQFTLAAKQLVGRKMTTEEVQRFFLDVYCKVEEDVTPNPTTAVEAKAYEEATEVIGQWCVNFDREKKLTGPNAWCAFNAVTRWFDHGKKYRANESRRAEVRLDKILFGSKVPKAKETALVSALALV